jgi:UDP-N-acetylmuramoylalanine--D-glutamate ligase
MEERRQMSVNRARLDGESISGERIAVLGAGTSGTSLALLARRLGADVLVSDSDRISDATAALLETAGASFEACGHTDKILGCDRVVVCSGFPPYAEIIKKISKRGVPISGELDFAAPFLRGKVIGITGSNGKTTTTSLLGHLLKIFYPGENGVAVAGNIGNPIADFALKEYEYIAAELSSFQLHWARGIVLDGAVITNLAPDHIDWHGSYENYAAAKTKILSFVKGAGHVPFEENGASGFFITREAERSELGRLAGRGVTLAWDSEIDDGKITLNSAQRRAYAFGGVLFDFADIPLLGSHNMENAAMAMAAAGLLGLDVEAARGGLGTYVPPPHRCSLVLTSAHGVRYIDDSKGTNVAAAVTAMSSIEGRKIIILGGRGKGENYSVLAEPLKKFAKWAFLMGEASEDIAAALRAEGYDKFSQVNGLEDAVRGASLAASHGDVVLLSPACTSWDVYKNYGERGDHFASLVREMTGNTDHERR